MVETDTHDARSLMQQTPTHMPPEEPSAQVGPSAAQVAEWIGATYDLLFASDGLVQPTLKPLLASQPDQSIHVQAMLMALRNRINDLYQETAGVPYTTWKEAQRLLLLDAHRNGTS